MPERSGAPPSLAEERHSLLRAGAAVGVRRVGADRDLLRAGERASRFVLLLDGLACRYRTPEDGRRRIVAFYVPGGLCDLAGVRAGPRTVALDCATAMLAPSKAVVLARPAVLGWMERRPRLRDVL